MNKVGGTQCRGMLGGDQQFYWDLGSKVETINETWDWSRSFKNYIIFLNHEY